MYFPWSHLQRFRGRYLVQIVLVRSTKRLGNCLGDNNDTVCSTICIRKLYPATPDSNHALFRVAVRRNNLFKRLFPAEFGAHNYSYNVRIKSIPAKLKVLLTV